MFVSGGLKVQIREEIMKIFQQEVHLRYLLLEAVVGGIES